MERTPRARRGLPALVAVVAWMLGVPSVALAAPEWQAREANPLEPTTITALPGGGAVLIGETSASSRDQLAARPLGGPVGAPAALPAQLGADVRVAGDAAGNMLIGDADTSHVAFRSSGGAMSAVQYLGVGQVVSRISMAPTGEALLLVGGGTRDLKVAFRPAGSDAQVDLANAQVLPGGDSPVGVQLDPSGAAVVVYRTDDGQVVQATRPAGAASFGDPVAVPSGTPGGGHYRVRLASSPAGTAVLTWGGSSTAGKLDRAVAAVRQPGGAFGPPTIVGGAVSVGGDVWGAVTAGGDALVAWTELTKAPERTCQSAADMRGADVVARVAVHRDATWSSAAMGPGTFPHTSAVEAVAAGGSTAALVVMERDGGSEQCSVVDDRSTLVAYRGVSGASFDWAPKVTLQASEPSGNANGQHYAVTHEGLAVGPDGAVLAAYRSGPPRFLRAFEDRAAPPPDDDDDPDPTTPAPAPESSSPPGPTPVPGPAPGLAAGVVPTPVPVAPPGILPIVPAELVAVPPLSGRAPAVTVTCPAHVADECRFRVGVHLRLTGRAGAAARRSRLLGTGRATVAAGKRKRIAIKLNRVGRRTARRRRAARVRVRTTVRVDGRTLTTSTVTRLKPSRRKPR